MNQKYAKVQWTNERERLCGRLKSSGLAIYRRSIQFRLVYHIYYANEESHMDMMKSIYLSKVT